ncbi:MAG: hypothetical protein JXB34_07310 [Bacteroidales bacterium]|nr:hypothetical protein [Bacteroidales bacterium]
MELSERLQYCRVCQKRQFSTSAGIICSLSGAKPTFDNECPDFSVDQVEAKRVLAREEKYAEAEAPETGFFAPEKKGMKKGILGGVAMIAIAIVWFFGGLFAGRIFFYPPVLLFFGIVAVVKGTAEKNIAGEKYKKSVSGN